MAFAEITRLATSAAVASAGSRTAIFILSSAPAAGHWIAVALYTNRGNIPSTVVSGSNNQVTAVNCGSIALSVIDSPTASGQTSPTLYAAPYQAGMTATVSVTWSNTVASTTLAFAAMVFSGADTTNTTGYANFRTASSTGAFDGGGTSTFGSGYTAASSGIVTWANSNDGVQTNYGDQKQPFIAAIVDTNVPTSATLQIVRACSVFGCLADSSGNVFAAFGTPGILPINNTTGVYDPAGGTGYAIGYGNYGNFFFTYTGISGGNLTGCALSNFGQDYTRAYIDSYGPIMLAGTNAVAITALMGDQGLSPRILGFTTGRSSAYSGTAQGLGANGHVMIGVGGTGTTPARLHLMGGYASNGRKTQSAYSVGRIGGGNVSQTNGGGVIYTMVPATRTITVAGNENSTGKTIGTDRAERVESGATQLINTIRGTEFATRFTTAANLLSTTVVGTKFATRILTGASTLVEATTSSKFTAYLRNASSSLTESVVVTKFTEMLKSSAVATTMASAGGKLVGYVMDASNSLTQSVVATQSRIIQVINAITQRSVATSGKIYEAIRSGLGVMEQSTSSGKLVAYINIATNATQQAITSSKIYASQKVASSTLVAKTVAVKAYEVVKSNIAVTVQAASSTKVSQYINIATNVAQQAITSAKSQVNEALGAAVQTVAVVGTKAKDFTKNATVALKQTTRAVKVRSLNVAGTAVAVMAIASYKVVAHLQFGSASLISNATSNKIGEAIRVTAVSLVSATKGTKRAEMNVSGSARSQIVLRATNRKERIVAGIAALSAVGKATRIVLFSKAGLASLRQRISVASYVYTISRAINVAFSETLEKGLYRERSTASSVHEDSKALFTDGATASSFNEGATGSYQEGQNHQ